MGMFKDLKKLKDQSKEIGEATGRPTTMRGMMKNLPNDLHAATEAVDSAMAMQADMAKQQALLTTGTPGTASIKGITDTGTLVNFNPQLIIDMEITVEGQSAYAHQLTTPVPQIHIPLIQPGNTIGVRVDPADPTSVALDWARPQG